MLREHSLVIREVIIEFVNFELRKISLFIKEKLKLTVIFSKHNHFIKGDYVNYVKSILIKKGKKKRKIIQNKMPLKAGHYNYRPREYQYSTRLEHPVFHIIFNYFIQRLA